MLHRWILVCVLLVMLLSLPAFAETKPDWFAQYEKILPLKCEPVRYICMHRDSNLCDLRNAEGKLLQEKYISSVNSETDFRDGYAIAFCPEDILYSSFINERGELIADFKFGNGGWWGSRYFSEGLCCLTFADEGRYGCIDPQGNTVIEPIYDYLSNFSEGLAYFKRDGQYGYINTKGEIVIEADTVSDLGSFHNGLAWIEDEYNRYGYINTKGEMAIPAIYRYAGNFSDGLAPVETADKTMGWIRPDGSFAIEPEYLYAGEFRNGIAEVGVGAGYMEEGFSGEPMEKRHYGLIDVNGKPVLPLIYDNINLQRGVNLAANEITAAAWAGDIPHYFRIADGQAVEIAGFIPDYKAEKRLNDAQTTAPETDALVFIVAEDHPLDSLTLEELKAIYSGKITHWADLGAESAGKITAYQHDDLSETQLEFAKLMQDIQLTEPPKEYLEGDYGDYVQPCDFRALPGSIGFCMQSMLDVSLTGKVKILSIDGKIPGEEGYPAMIEKTGHVGVN